MEQLEDSILPEKPVFYAEPWQRFCSELIDVIILRIVFIGIQKVLIASRIDYSIFEIQIGRLWYNALYKIVSIVFNFFYNACLESSSKQATIGKMIFKIKVTNVEGERINILQAAFRHFGKYVSISTLFIGFIMMLWNDKHQTLHDKMAGTLVVKN